MMIEETIRLMKFMRNGYQKLIDENCAEGTVVGTDVTGTWKSSTQLTEVYQKHIDACDTAIEALEKQIPKKAVMDYGFPEKLREVLIHSGDKEKAEYKTDCCPVCKRPLGISQFVKTQTGKAYGDSYCKRCGQKILWED